MLIDCIQIISIIVLTLSLCVDVKEVDVMKKEEPIRVAHIIGKTFQNYSITF